MPLVGNCGHPTHITFDFSLKISVFCANVTKPDVRLVGYTIWLIQKQCSDKDLQSDKLRALVCNFTLPCLYTVFKVVKACSVTLFCLQFSRLHRKKESTQKSLVETIFVTPKEGVVTTASKFIPHIPHDCFQPAPPHNSSASLRLPMEDGHMFNECIRTLASAHHHLSHFSRSA